MAMLLAHGANAVVIDFECGSGLCGFTTVSTEAVNIRPFDDVINRNTATGFDKFFETSFLVIGDKQDSIANDPNNGTTTASYSLGKLAAGTYSYFVEFDYVVDTNSANGISPDDFLVSFTGVDTGGLVLKTDSIAQNATPRKKEFFNSVGFTLTQERDVNLSFSLIEESKNNSSAAGIDNLTIQQVPEPGSFALGAMALLSLAAVRRRHT